MRVEVCIGNKVVVRDIYACFGVRLEDLPRFIVALDLHTGFSTPRSDVTCAEETMRLSL